MLTIIEFLEKEGIDEIRGTAGRYTARELSVELQIREKSLCKSNIVSDGVRETIERLAEIDPETVVRNYLFKSDSKSVIVYLDQSEQTMIGAVLIADRIKP